MIDRTGDAEFWNDKHPRAPIVYEGRPIPGSTRMFAMDVRRFFWSDDVVLQGILSGAAFDNARAATDNDARAYFVQVAVCRMIQYVGDETIQGKQIQEFWTFPAETIARRVGDCEDGAILIASLCANLGIPLHRIRVAAGMVRPGAGAADGGHAWATYLRESDNEWIALDWCYFSDESSPVKDKLPVRLRPEYHFGNRVWFSFNDLYSWTHEPDGLRLSGRVKIGQRRSKA